MELHSGGVDAAPDAGVEQREQAVYDSVLHENALINLHQVLTARADGPDGAAERKGLARFAGLFVGNLWDVAARKVLTYAPF